MLNGTTQKNAELKAGNLSAVLNSAGSVLWQSFWQGAHLLLGPFHLLQEEEVTLAPAFPALFLGGQVSWPFMRNCPAGKYVEGNTRKQIS